MTHPRVAIPDYFASFIVERFGDLGRRWIDELPDIVDRYATDWDLAVRLPFDGLSYNFVLPVVQSNGERAVLKIGLPEPEQRSEIYALRAFDGRGSARLIRDDAERHVALIEQLEPGIMLSTLFPNDDDEATRIAAGLMVELRTEVPEDRSNFHSMEEWVKRGMAGLRETFDGGVGPFPRDLVERAESHFTDLFESTRVHYLIHGDLHHMNILANECRGGWLAIDPKGMIADAAYETSAFILNPNVAIHDVSRRSTIFDRRIAIFSEELGIDRQRIHAWALAFAILSAWWSYSESSRGSWRKTIALAADLDRMTP